MPAGCRDSEGLDLRSYGFRAAEWLKATRFLSSALLPFLF